MGHVAQIHGATLCIVQHTIWPMSTLAMLCKFVKVEVMAEMGKEIIC